MPKTQYADKRRSPIVDLRDGLELEVLEPYQSPRVLVRQAKIDQSSELPDRALPNEVKNKNKNDKSTSKSTSKSPMTWLSSRLSSAPKNRQGLKHRISDHIARLSSLDSTQSSSSVEDPNDQQHHHQHPTPLISITNPNDTQGATNMKSGATGGGGGGGDTSNSRLRDARSARGPSASQLRADYYRNYYGRSRSNHQSRTESSNGRRSGTTSGGFRGGPDDYDYDDLDDDDAFEDAPLPMPYSSSSMARTVVVRQQTDKGVSYPSKSGEAALHSRLSHYEELLDDRQGMNNSEQQFTKAEKLANRASLDGSIISESRVDLKKATGHGGVGGSSGSNTRMTSTSGSQHKRDKRRSKSPNSMFGSKSSSRRHSRRGFLGLASRLKLTKKHESIAKLQLSILNSGFVSLKTLDRDLQTFLPKERLSVREFQERVKLMRKFEVLSTIEYRFASKYETYVCKHAQQETNQPKNNYKKCIPYDYNRVVLKTLPNVTDSDYINASHVDSCLKPNAYIAAQGPNENTIEDFWRMIWEQKTFVVVMLTKVFDFIRVMCNQYWPVELNKPERYGNIEVTLLYEEPLADFVIRTIRVSKLRGGGGGGDTAVSQTEGDNNNDNNGNDSATNAAAPNTRPNSQARMAYAGDTDQEYLSTNYDTDFDDYYEDDGDGYDDEDDADGTLASGLLEDDNGRRVQELDSDQRSQSLMVRAPKFAATRSRGPAGRERSLPPRELRQIPIRIDTSQRTNSHNNDLNGAPEINYEPSEGDFVDNQQGLLSAYRLNRSTSTLPGGRDLAHTSASQTALNEEAAEQALGAWQQRPKSQPTQQVTKNEFLHPLFNATQLTSSLNSLSSEPNTPLTPHTPSSAGLDRSSATRKAVKKKRRERIKNQRPRTTKFLVPTESQLQDDDEDDQDNLLATGTGTAGTAGTGTSPKDEPGGGGGGGTRSSERIIYQFHYNSWASHTCPFISSLLHFRRRVRICMDEMSKSGKTGPTVVHCNDGCGRTGAYLCIDANLELADEDNVIDIYNYTRKMRQSRKFLIENLEQYKFVYDTIEEAIYCGKTWFPVSELHKRLKHKSQRNPLTRKNEYLLEYEKICQMTSKFSIGDCAGGHRVENREKNRDVSTVPPDNFRPYLTSFQTNDSTDYINAVFVDGYTRSKEYIVTEWPLHRTISDFWSLVYDHDCNSVILLANPGESTNYPSFLPSEKELRRKFGPVFSAEMVSYTHYQNIKSWIYTINKKIVSLTEVIAGVKSEAKTTQVFQITCWPQGHRVPTSTNALVELMNMVERWRQRTTYGPVCVVSLNGKSRAGVYCAANVAIEQVVQHSEVDVFNAVKTVRRHRPQLIENMTEYKYCYDLILHYVLHYVNNQSSTNN